MREHVAMTRAAEKRLVYGVYTSLLSDHTLAHRECGRLLPSTRLQGLLSSGTVSTGPKTSLGEKPGTHGQY